MSALCQKRTFRRLVGYDYSVPGKVLKLAGHHHGTSPSQIPASRNRRRGAPNLVRCGVALDYPTRPVHLIVGFPAGFTPDIIARLTAQALSERLGKQIIVDNRPGAASNIGTELVVKALPDGYTLLGATGANAINATLYENLSFNFIRDIAPVASIVRAPLVMTVNPSVPADTVPRTATIGSAVYDVLPGPGGRVRRAFAAVHYVRFWHKADIPTRSTNVRFCGLNGHDADVPQCPRYAFPPGRGCFRLHLRHASGEKTARRRIVHCANYEV